MKKLLLFVFAALALSLVACEQLEDIFNSDDDKIELLCGEQLSFISYQGDTKRYTFSTTLDWIANDSESWMEVSPTSGYAGESIIDVTIDKNNSDERRTGHVDITMTNGMSYRINIEQYAADKEVISGTVPSNEIWYTSYDGDVVTPNETNVFGATIISNEYNNGMGVITFDGDVTTIGNYAFAWCDSLTSVTIGNSITTIGEGAFYGCCSLTSVNIPDSVTTIGDQAFYDCRSLTSVNIGDSLTTIGEWAFESCTSLTSVTIPDSITMIGGGAFAGCTSLTSITIPDSVTEIGERAFSSCDSLTGVTIGNGVKTIGNYAFSSCTSLTSVNIPDSITEIGERAFYECDSLTSVTIGNSVTTIGSGAFSDCPSLKEFKGKFAEDNGRILVVDGVLAAFAPTGITEYTIPDSVTTIGYEAFIYCNSLTSVTIPDSVTSIRDYAFYFCTSLTSVYCKATTPPALGGPDVFDANGSGRKIYVPTESVEVYKSTEYWDEYKYAIVGYDFGNGEIAEIESSNEIWYTSSDGIVVLPKREYVFGANIISNTYDNGKGVITFDGDVTSIGNEAFSQCFSLTSITIPDSVTTIGEYAFYNCYNLTSITIPDNVTAIGTAAFKECTNLTSATIGNSVTTIGEWAFEWCFSLTSITIPDSVITIGKNAFYMCDNMTSVNIGDSVTEIGVCAFSDCYSLTSVTIGDSVTTIGHYAFRNCESLTSVNIPDSTTTIGPEAFCNCSSLTSVNIPDSVTEIGWFAFFNCTSLTSVYCPSITPPKAVFNCYGEWHAFYNNASAPSGRKIYVPVESILTYQLAEGWGQFATSITGYDF